MQQSDQTIIAIDGYSSCGKSTFARLIARDLNYVYIDSGAMYRAVALYCIENGILSEQPGGSSPIAAGITGNQYPFQH